MRKVRIEPAGRDEDSFCDAYALLTELHREVGIATLDVEKATNRIYTALGFEMAWIARVNDQLAGVLVLVEAGWWFSSDPTFYTDLGFFVRPQFRTLSVGAALLRAARRAAEKKGKMVFVEEFNPDKANRANSKGRISQRAGFVPAGYRVRVR